MINWQLCQWELLCHFTNLYQNLSGGTENNHEKIQNNLTFGWVLKEYFSPNYKAGVLKPNPQFQ
jgi:hypothetical protein